MIIQSNLSHLLLRFLSIDISVSKDLGYFARKERLLNMRYCFEHVDFEDVESEDLKVAEDFDLSVDSYVGFVGTEHFDISATLIDSRTTKPADSYAFGVGSSLL